jgi:hypothetical protein
MLFALSLACPILLVALIFSGLLLRGADQARRELEIELAACRANHKAKLKEALDKERETFGAAFQAADKWYRGQILELRAELRRERAKRMNLWN